MNIDGKELQRLKRSAQKTVNNDGAWRAHPQTVLWLCEDIEELHGALREARLLAGVSGRRAGWYWVKDGSQWEPLWFNGVMWDGHHSDHDLAEIGPRIPAPDEPWDIVPAVPTDTMIEVGELAQSAFSTWMGMKAAAPKPEDV